MSSCDYVFAWCSPLWLKHFNHFIKEDQCENNNIFEPIIRNDQNIEGGSKGQ